MIPGIYLECYIYTWCDTAVTCGLPMSAYDQLGAFFSGHFVEADRTLRCAADAHVQLHV